VKKEIVGVGGWLCEEAAWDLGWAQSRSHARSLIACWTGPPSTLRSWLCPLLNSISLLETKEWWGLSCRAWPVLLQCCSIKGALGKHPSMLWRRGATVVWQEFMLRIDHLGSHQSENMGWKLNSSRAQPSCNVPIWGTPCCRMLLRYDKEERKKEKRRKNREIKWFRRVIKASECMLGTLRS